MESNLEEGRQHYLYELEKDKEIAVAQVEVLLSQKHFLDAEINNLNVQISELYDLISNIRKTINVSSTAFKL